MRYCAIEGSSYAGKTSIIRNFARQGIPIMEEPKIEQLGQKKLDEIMHMPEGLEKYISIIDGYLNLYSRRRERIAGLALSTGLVVADRSILSPIVFETFATQFGLGDGNDRLRSREYAIRRVDEEVRAGREILPQCIVILNVANRDEFNRRVVERAPNGSPVSDYERSMYWANLTFLYSKAVLGESAVRYEVQNSGLERKEAELKICMDVFAIVNNLPVNNAPNPINILLPSDVQK